MCTFSFKFLLTILFCFQKYHIGVSVSTHCHFFTIYTAYLKVSIFFFSLGCLYKCNKKLCAKKAFHACMDLCEDHLNHRAKLSRSMHTQLYTCTSLSQQEGFKLYLTLLNIFYSVRLVETLSRTVLEDYFTTENIISKLNLTW